MQNACSLVLTDQPEEQQEYLFDSLVQNQILVPSSKSIFLFQDISTQCILVQLLSCYSPQCKNATTSQCYSPTCPLKPLSVLEVKNPTIDDTVDWSYRIPRYILEDLTAQEKKRQLAIEELVSYEENFLKQLFVIRDVFARPLLSSLDIIEEARRFPFHDTLFGNYHVLANLHRKMLRDLEGTRDKSTFLFPDSRCIGDLLLKHFKKFTDPYIRYASNHVFAEYQYKLEWDKNTAFVAFIEQQESIEKDFRLPLKDLLVTPIIRITKYVLLFTTILKNSPLLEHHASFLEISLFLPDLLHKINEAIRNAQSEQRLMEIKYALRVRRLSIPSQKHRISQILPDDAVLIFEGSLELINRIPPIMCQLFLFSNALFITREKSSTENRLEYTLIDKAIPLYMLKLGHGTSRLSSRSKTSTSSTSSQQSTIFSSIRHQLSSGSYHHQRPFNEQVTPDAMSVRSDDGSSTYSAIYTISGLKLRHRIRTIKQRIKRKNKTSAYTAKSMMAPASSSSSPTVIRVASPRGTGGGGGGGGGVIRPRLLQISHLADPNLTYLFECDSADIKLAWKNKIKSILPNPDLGPFELELICSKPNCSALRSVEGRFATGCGTIWCSLPFTTSEGRSVIALGTRYGLWVAYSDGTEGFKLVLGHNCHQIELFDNRMLLVRGFKPNRVLGAILIDDIYPSSTGTTVDTSNEMMNRDENKEFQLLQKTGVISFAVGTLRGEPILCYLRRRRTGSVRLVLMLYRVEAGSSSPWFKKCKEYKPISVEPTDLKIIQDTVYIRSRTEGVEKVDIVNWIMGSTNAQNNSYQHVKYSFRISLPAVPYHVTIGTSPQLDDPSLTTIAYVPLNQPGTGLICSAEAAWPVAETDADLLQPQIMFETEAKYVVVSFPYLIVFSTNVIEIRHLETTALVQAIAGNKIRCVYVSRTDPLSSTAPIIHITMLHAEEDQTKLYQLYLKEPMAFDE
ncbi:hypothetical protein INT47_011387 [Mucor saturninus]|uniref:DH domain-containing protein n=1 Tax=Mucor saturninus TaxID=64648 RepID=A0A8H7UWQ5_9FUNG|nr:hypothetical protein INT47_011387 [Mucor saturninus]